MTPATIFKLVTTIVTMISDIIKNVNVIIRNIRITRKNTNDIMNCNNQNMAIKLLVPFPNILIDNESVKLILLCTFDAHFTP